MAMAHSSRLLRLSRSTEFTSSSSVPTVTLAGCTTPRMPPQITSRAHTQRLKPPMRPSYKPIRRIRSYTLREGSTLVLTVLTSSSMPTLVRRLPPARCMQDRSASQGRQFTSLEYLLLSFSTRLLYTTMNDNLASW